MPSNTSPSGREKRPSARAVMEVGGWWDGSYLKRYVSIFPGPGGGNLDTLPPPILSASFLILFFSSSLHPAHRHDSVQQPRRAPAPRLNPLI